MQGFPCPLHNASRTPSHGTMLASGDIERATFSLEVEIEKDNFVICSQGSKVLHQLHGVAADSGPLGDC